MSELLLHAQDRPPEILAASEGIGCVYRCPNGCLHVCIGETELRLSPQRYWGFVAMLSESSQSLATQEPRPANPDVN